MSDAQPMQNEEIADRVFKALASRPRRKILLMLASGEGAEDARCCGANEICACVFSEKLGLSASTVSHHLKVLTEAELVESRKDGLWVYYNLRPEVIAAVANDLKTIISGGCCAS
ncbi:MAG TPA: metalloregulator ArsR/SmtB family transcription factor [Coriobacteriia bacterium]|nr:metalloregulator ArsR/SmtB family transcription factor [Coriobacteriia bacterium]